MAQLWNFETESIESVDDQQVHAALASGKYGVNSLDLRDGDDGSRVNIVSAEGQRGSVPVGEVLDATGKGWRIESTEEQNAVQMRRRAADSPVGAAAFALADTATMGALSHLATKDKTHGARIAEAIQALREENPAASMAGSIAGTLYPTGPLSWVGKAGMKLGKAASGAKALAGGGLAKQALRGATTLGTAGAIEGAAIGTQQLVTEDALGNADFNAESLVAHAGVGALVGLGAGVGLGAAGPTFKHSIGSIGRRLGDSKTISAGLDDAARGAALSAARIPKASRVKLARLGKLDDAADAMLTMKAPDGKPILHLRATGQSVDDIAQRLRATLDDRGKQIGDFFQKLDDTAKAKAGSLTDDSLVSGQSIADKITKHVNSLDLNPDSKGAIKLAKQWAKKFEGSSGPMTFQQAQKHRRSLAKSWNQSDKVVKNEVRRKIERIINEEIESKAESFAKAELTLDDFTDFKAAKNDFSKLALVTESSENQAIGGLANAFFGLRDTAVGAASVAGNIASGSTGLQAAAEGGVTALAMKLVRERGTSFGSVMLHKASSLKAIQKSSDAVQKRITQAVSRFSVSSSKRVRTISVGTKALSMSLDNSRKVASTHDRQKLFNERAAEITRLAQANSDLADRIATNTRQMESAAPNHAQRASVVAAKIVQFLNARLPRSLLTPSRYLQPELEKKTVNPSEMSRFSRYYAAAVKPLSVLEDLANGTLTKEGVEALRELYPVIYEKTKSELMTTIGQKKDRVGFNDRVILSMFFQVPLDPQMEPEFIRRAQGIYRQESQGQAPRGQAPQGMRVTGLDKIKAPESMKTPAQRREEPL